MISIPQYPGFYLGVQEWKHAHQDVVLHSRLRHAPTTRRENHAYAEIDKIR